MSNTPIIEVAHLPEVLQPEGMSTVNQSGAVSLHRMVTYKQAMDELEECLLTRAVAEHGSTRKIAKILEINQSTVVRKLQQYKLLKNDV